jgi:hypothetical protein
VIKVAAGARAIALLLAGVLVASCGSSTSTDQPTGPAGTSSVTVLPSVASPSEFASATPPTETTPALEVAFTKSVPTKRWGDKPFKVVATATNGARIVYTAEGGCDVGASNGTVRINAVGTCAITAEAADSDPPATDSLNFDIEPARPVIDFGKDSTRFKRDMRYALAATTDPRIDLSYEVVHGANGSANDEECAVDGAALVWAHLPNADRFPSLDAFCMVRVTATRSSKNYVTPDPVQALIHIDYPAWNVHAQSQELSFADGDTQAVTVFEDTGDALGMELDSTDGPCGSAATEEKVPLGTTKYILQVQVDNPADHPDIVDANGAYTCTMHASALPPDWQNGAKGKAEATFILTVTP